MRCNISSLARWVLFLLIYTVVLAAPAPAFAKGSWEGFWATYSFGDDAYISLRQDGKRVI